MKKIRIPALFCILILLAPKAAQSCNDANTTESTDIERTTEVTVQTPGGLYVTMLTDDPFIQVTFGCAVLFIITSAALAWHHLYTSNPK